MITRQRQNTGPTPNQNATQWVEKNVDPPGTQLGFVSKEIGVYTVNCQIPDSNPYLFDHKNELVLWHDSFNRSS